MIRIVLAVTVLMMATSTVGSQEVAGGNGSMADMQAANKHAITELFEECFNHGDLERLPALIAEEYQGPNGQKGPGAFASTITQIRASLSGAHYQVEEMVGEGN